MLTFWYDFASSYSYLAAMRMEDAAGAAKVEVAWRPFLLGPVFKAAGYDGSPNLVAPSKANYMWRDIARRAERRGLGFVMPNVFPQRSVAGCRAALALEGAERRAFTRALYEEQFARGADIADLATIAKAAEAAGLDPERVVAGASDPDAKAALFANVEEAMAAGVFGAPTFATSDGELFWGDDRLDDALAWEKTGALPEGR